MDKEEEFAEAYSSLEEVEAVVEPAVAVDPNPPALLTVGRMEQLTTRPLDV